MRKNVPFLGHVISKDGVSTNPEKVKAVSKWPVPVIKSELRSFLGLASYYRRFIQNFASIAAPLHQLLTAGNEKHFVWTEACDRAFLELKQRLVKAPVLSYPTFNMEYILDIDASDTGIGAVLSQVHDGQEKVIAYASRTLSKSERNYSTTKREILALVYYSQHLRHYLYGQKFVARTDHAALRWLTNFKEPTGQVARWLEKLAEFDFKVQARPGKRHGNADGLSRRPPEPDSELPVVSTVTNDDSFSWCSMRTTAELRSEQVADPTVDRVLVWRERRTEPPLQIELQGTGPAVRKLCSHWDALEVRDGVLYRRWEDEKGAVTRFLLVVAKSLVPEVLSALHYGPSAGHLGVTKTLGKVRERFYWLGQREDVEDWLQHCVKCSTSKAAKAGPRAPLVSCVPGYPLERVAIDILGPLPETENHNKYIMVVADYFTKWTESYTLPNQEARTVAQKLVDEFICRFGAPERIHTDQGRNFESALFKEMCALLGVEKTRTTPYHPIGDGMLERFNRSLAAMLSKYVNENHRTWDIHLPKVMMAYRSSAHESTKFPPFRLMFGRDVRLPADLMFGRTPNYADGYPEYVRELRERLEKAHELARAHIGAAQYRQKEYYDRRAGGEPYAVGDRVWLYTPVIKKGQTAKLHSP